MVERCNSALLRTASKWTFDQTSNDRRSTPSDAILYKETRACTQCFDIQRALSDCPSLPRLYERSVNMLRDLSYAAIAALLAGSVHGAPVEPEVKVTSMSHPIGHDSDYVHIASLNEVVPQHITHTLDHMNLTDVHAWNPTGSIEKRLNGEDNRYQYTDTTNYPFRATGRIIWSNGVFCSGALVGPRHVLTAKHCALTDGSTGIFYPGYDNGASSYGQGNIVLFYTVDQTGGQCDTKYDHAVMVLDNRLGDALGYFGAVTPDSSMHSKLRKTSSLSPG